MSYQHITAMPIETLKFLNCIPGKIIVDGTLGGFGHAKLICNELIPDGILIGLDQDQDAIKNVEKIKSSIPLKLYIKHGNFLDLGKFLEEINIPLVDGILIDIGISLHQIKKSGRGFSFLKDEPLDMRMNVFTKTTAAMLLEKLKEKEIASILIKYGEERWANRIAYYLVKSRNISPIKTSYQLANLVKKAIPKKYAKTQKIHPATRVFMALRIAVNQELTILEKFLKEAIHLLNPKGRLCVLSFHSLEDRIVKNVFKTFENPCTCPYDFPICICNLNAIAKVVTKKVIRPSKKEIIKNPMARSTRLRVVEKI